MAMYGYVELCMAVGLRRAMYRCVWQCMAVYGYVGLCMASYTYVGLCMTVYGCVWLYRAI